jgi:hypothetical protein
VVSRASRVRRRMGVVPPWALAPIVFSCWHNHFRVHTAPRSGPLVPTSPGTPEPQDSGLLPELVPHPWVRRVLDEASRLRKLVVAAALGGWRGSPPRARLQWCARREARDLPRAQRHPSSTGRYSRSRTWSESMGSGSGTPGPALSVHSRYAGWARSRAATASQGVAAFPLTTTRGTPGTLNRRSSCSRLTRLTRRLRVRRADHAR